VRGVLRVARQHNATQIVVASRCVRPLGHFSRRLVYAASGEESGDIDIHVVRADNRSSEATAHFPQAAQLAGKYLLSLGVAGRSRF